MRHKDSGRKLNRNSAHRKAMFRNMTASLVAHEMIRTTTPKAKSLRRFAEPLITLAREDTVANRRLAFARLRNHDAVGKLFSTLGKRYRDRPGGYLRILKAGFRPGDRAPMAVVELVGRPEHALTPDIEREQRFAEWTERVETQEREKAATRAAGADSAATDAKDKKKDGKKDGKKDEQPAADAGAAAEPAPTQQAKEEQPEKSKKKDGLLSRIFRRDRKDKE